MGTSLKATASFDVANWDEQPCAEHDGTKITRTTLAKTFTGDIEGTSEADMLMAYGQEKGSAAYGGFERLSVSVNGRKGTFVLQYAVSSNRGDRSTTISVVPDSGTGELAGISGTAHVEEAPNSGHLLTLDAQLD